MDRNSCAKDGGTFALRHTTRTTNESTRRIRPLSFNRYDSSRDQVVAEYDTQSPVAGRFVSDTREHRNTALRETAYNRDAVLSTQIDSMLADALFKASDEAPPALRLPKLDSDHRRSA